MSKAMLIIDMPKSCSDCKLKEMAGDFNKMICVPLQKSYNKFMFTEKRQEQCPLRFVPSKKYHSCYGSGQVEMSDDKIWNKCIDTILGQ